MGSIVGKAMDENMKKQQDFILKTGQITLERQIQMQNQMRERQVAIAVARARDIFVWFGSFYATSAFLMLAGFAKKKNPGVIAPLIPLTFILGYQFDLAYGTKIKRLQAEADRIIDLEPELLDMPHGLPSFSDIERERMKQKDALRLHGHDIFL
ncbi:hypothetical protein ACJMK2_042281 [Sinanodonta woodiana]|uniref:Plasminogen receptor (KT) n=1 Tax=Sinanodonta woodiana TaxID=1069815 RepID=A0ABD3W6T2_SINWO